MPRFALALALALVVALSGVARADAPSMREAPPLAVVDAPTDLELPVRIVHGRILVRAESGLEDEAREVAARADTELTSIDEDLHGLPTPERAEIRLVNDGDDMARAAPAGADVPSWAAGVAFPAQGLVVVAKWHGANRIDLDGTVDHELAHLALGAALGDHAPRWLHEGFAYLHSTDFSWDRAETLGGMAWFGSVIPLDELEVGFPAEELPASRAYAESYDFVAYLARRGRAADGTDANDRYAFRAFLADIARGADLDSAARQAYGRPLQNLFDEWRADLKDRFLFLPIGLFLLSIWLIAVVLLVLAWRRRRRQNRARLDEWDAIERAARASAPRDPDDPDPRHVPVVPVWAGPLWAPPGAPVSEPAVDDIDAVLEDDEDTPPRPPPPPRRVN